MPKIFVIAGPNGASKTTAALTLLPDIISCNEYLNADSIAAALFSFHPEAVAIQAGRLLLQRIHTLVEHKKAGRSIAIWRDNKVVKIAAKNIRIPKITTKNPAG